MGHKRTKAKYRRAWSYRRRRCRRLGSRRDFRFNQHESKLLKFLQNFSGWMSSMATDRLDLALKEKEVHSFQ